MRVYKTGLNAPPFSQAFIERFPVKMIDVPVIDLRDPVHGILTGDELNPVKIFKRQIRAAIRENSKRHTAHPFCL